MVFIDELAILKQNESKNIFDIDFKLLDFL